MYPLDVVKTVQQLKVGQGEGTMKIITDIIKREKFGIYRGIGAPLLMETPKRAIKFTAVRCIQLNMIYGFLSRSSVINRHLNPGKLEHFVASIGTTICPIPPVSHHGWAQ